MKSIAIAAALLASSLMCAQSARTPEAPQLPKEIPTFDVNAIDKQVNPCDDFYQFSCGSWLKNNPIPPDQSSWGRFDQLNERNEYVLKAILEKDASAPGNNPIARQVGDYYAACMDETLADKKGAAPLDPEFRRINAITSKSQVIPAVVTLHMNGTDTFFSYSSDQDFKDATQEIPEVDQAGIALPDRDYYLKEDAKSQQIRQQYVEHMQKMFQLVGDSPGKAQAEAKAVMNIETQLAKGSMDRVSRRDPASVYHKMSLQDVQKLSPSIAWSSYFDQMGTPNVTALNVVAPDFLKQLSATLDSTSLDDLKTYLRWHVLHDEARLLSKPFVDENFRFFRTVLTGAEQNRPRWKRCVSSTDSQLGEALGRQYVDETFGAEGKARTLALVRSLEESLNQDIKTLPWMTDQTKQEALKKLAQIRNKIGYPDNWRDYSSVKIDRADLVGNYHRAAAFEVRRQLNKIGKPVNEKEWDMSPPTVNANYNPQMNDINFPAGILQPPFYSNRADDAPNFGGIGAVIGHELTHGFDDEGRQFDPAGNLRDWWTPVDAKAFQERAQCIVDEYSNFVATDDVKLNGKLVLGENTADNGGARIAYMSMLRTPEGKDPLKTTDGYTPAQRFFIGFGQIWCEGERPEYLRMLATVDPHSPGKWRANGTVQNMPEFAQAFACKAGQKMVREPACRVW
jgi:putative endopeptidase